MLNLNKQKIFILFIFLIGIISIFKISYPFIKDSDENLIFQNTNLVKNNVTSDDYTFVVLGDNKNSISTFNKIIQQINNDNSVKFVINTGDMVFDSNPIKYDFFLKQLKNLNKPMLPVFGNHDVADGGVGRYIDIFGPLYYSFNLKNSYFIMLNNSNEEELDPWQMNWLKDELEKSKNYKYTFVFMHVPIYDPRKDINNQPGHSLKNLSNAEELLNLLNNYDITQIFFGHIHGYYIGKWKNVPYTVTGGAGAELVGKNPDHDFYHYIKVHVNDNNVSYELVKLDSPDFNFIDRVFAVYTYTLTLSLISGLYYF
ncbi:metallophosphoesterase [Marinitoga sp. 38H-ov]|jgi:predicted phosphodiesterase|uniref:metallophosphoesterase family protein n=1 Tax=Marinitoga sp. 38H-ov TaxID=1755814 RepID=UPI0013ECFCFD|nr:metallophosphoesterase [Marinitoga sp. 38H-ov]KAF2955806.1 hypothetical protein AS160_09190 [Marinitoga sp. 38H-ov]